MRYFLILISIICLLPGISGQDHRKYLEAARQNLQQENFTGAMINLNKAEQIEKRSYEIYFLRGLAKYYLGDNIGAYEDYTQSIKLAPYHSEVFHNRAIVNSQLMNFSEALRDFSKAIKFDSTNANVFVNRAKTRLFLMHYNEAIDDCNKAIELGFKLENVYLLRGLALAGMEQYEMAIENLNQAILKNPGNLDTYIQRGSIWIDLNEQDSAMKDLSFVISKDSNNAYAIFNRALISMKLKEYDKALDDLNKTNELAPLNTLAYYNKAVLYIQKNEKKKAIKEFDNVIKLNPDNIIAYYYRGQLKSESGDWAGALKDYDKAIELFPEFATAYYERYRARRELKQFEAAFNDLNIAKEMGEKLKKISDTLSFERQAYLRSIVSMSGSFENFNPNHQKLQNRNIPVDMEPMFKTVPAMIDSGNLNYYDAYGKKYYPVNIIALSKDPFESKNYIPDSYIDTLQNKLKQLPEDKSLIYQRSLFYSYNQNFNRAFQDYDSLLKQDTDFIMAYFDRACLKAELINMQQSAWNNQAYILMNDNDQRPKDSLHIYTFEDVIDDFSRVISLDSQNAFAYYNRAYAKYLMNDYSAAIEDFDRTITLNPGIGEAYFNRGLLQILLGDKEKGCSNISKAGESGLLKSYFIINRYCKK